MADLRGQRVFLRRGTEVIALAVSLTEVATLHVQNGRVDRRTFANESETIAFANRQLAERKAAGWVPYIVDDNALFDDLRIGGQVSGGASDGNSADESEQDNGSDNTDTDDARSVRTDRTDTVISDSSSSGSERSRESDGNYEMSFKAIAKIMEDAFSRPAPTKFRRLVRWHRVVGDKTIDEENCEAAELSLTTPLAGSCSRLRLFVIKDSDGILHRRVFKLPRDSKHDARQIFADEFRNDIKMRAMARFCNRHFRSRFDVVFWPVEIVQFWSRDFPDEFAEDEENKLHCALAQAPLMPPRPLIFRKVQSNMGEHLYEDLAVQRLQHAMAAISKNIHLVRDWQGFLLPPAMLRRLAAQQHITLHQLPSSSGSTSDDSVQNANVNNFVDDGGRRVFVLIDPVLVHAHAHFRNQNPTDFGTEALFEWKKWHNCKEARCAAFGIRENTLHYWGLADDDLEFFLQESALYNEQSATAQETRGNKARVFETPFSATSSQFTDRIPSSPPSLSVTRTNQRKCRCNSERRHCKFCVRAATHGLLLRRSIQCFHNELRALRRDVLRLWEGDSDSESDTDANDTGSDEPVTPATNDEAISDSEADFTTPLRRRLAKACF